MPGSKKKRMVPPLARTIPTEEVPDFYENFKVAFLEKYKNDLGLHLNLMHDIHELINDKVKDFNKLNKNNEKLKSQENIKFSLAHQKVDRGSLIESVVIFDNSVDEILTHFQTRKLNKKSDEINNWWKTGEGLNECLKGHGLPKEFCSQRSLMVHFRSLRHQFAHNSLGIFSFEANKENFEPFLNTLEGINLGSPMHVLIDGEAGVAIFYKLNSSKFMDKFFKESVTFVSMLLEILFPTKTKKVFNFKK